MSRVTRSTAASVVAATLLLAAGSLAVPGRANSAETAIQPGARIVSPAGCSLNFVFEDAAGAKYIGTAGHCTSSVGNRVAHPGAEFGTVVFRVLNGSDDFALIRVDPAHYHEVNPQMRRWGGPTGVATPAETGIGDPIMLYGYGTVLGSTAVTRPRTGPLYTDNSKLYRAEVPAIFGDSGSAVLHGPSGKALGVAATILPHMLNGPTIARALDLLAAAGIHVQIVTAPLTLV